MQNRIYGIIEDEGIDIYRQDFNIAPLYFWQNGNTAGVDAGLTENLYIQNYMKFFWRICSTVSPALCWITALRAAGALTMR